MVDRRGPRRHNTTVFGKAKASKQQPSEVVCPMCRQELGGIEPFHWDDHVKSNGSGGFTWTCECGPSQLTFEKRAGANTALRYHLHHAHHISVTIAPHELTYFDNSLAATRLRGLLS